MGTCRSSACSHKRFWKFLIFFRRNEAESCGGLGGLDLQGLGRVFLSFRANGDDKPVLGMNDGGVFKDERIGSVRQFPSIQKDAGVAWVVDNHVAGARFQSGGGLLKPEAFASLAKVISAMRRAPCSVGCNPSTYHSGWSESGCSASKRLTLYLRATAAISFSASGRLADEPLSEPAYLRTSG